jgi:hypothetical protein
MTTTEGDAGTDGDDATARAERIVDQVQQTASSFAEQAARGVAGTGALAREEAEDIWAEARSVRRGL